MRTRLFPLLLLGALLGVAAPAAADTPRAGALYADGPSGRYLLGGEWLFRLDPSNQGLGQGFARSAARTGWAPVRVPHAWNLGDDSVESFLGTIGWYRKDFTLPDARAALRWAIRFESVNYRTRVWLNGRRVGENKGAYVPFEFYLQGLKRRGTNRLVVRVDNRRFPTDFPPSGLNSIGQPTGGWWNYGGLLREVYLRRVDTADFKQVVVRPVLPCAACPATVQVRVALRNVTPRATRLRITAQFGARRLNLGRVTVGPNGVTATARSLTLARPHLWSPADPFLYRARVEVRSGRRVVASHSLHSGVRSVRISGDGRLLLNGQYVNFRGLGYHEDSKTHGFAVDNAFRERLMAEAKALGATLLRTHYPPHPYLHELADRQGMLLWSEVPVYANKTRYLKRGSVRELAAKELRKNIETNQNHPSVLLWSIANELSSRPGPTLGSYFRRAAGLAKELDPTRPVGIAVASNPNAGCQAEYAPLDVIGFNEYYGWYPGPDGVTFDRTKLSGYLDSVRQCYPDKAIVVSEFGAEANRDGPVEEKGTWLFQRDFVNYHLDVHDSKPWLSGSAYWALNEFRVRPSWDGGNPRPASPIHQKGLLTYDFGRKPAWAEVERRFKAARQFVPPVGPRRGGR
jgi:beta-glucuronidase